MDSIGLSNSEVKARQPDGPRRLLLLFLLIEFFDEWCYSAEAAALPTIRGALGLDYAQVGLLLGLPGLLNAAIEPLVMLLGDTPFRRRLILSGGVIVSATLLTAGLAPSFAALLAAFVLNYPASGAFVTLSQATWIGARRGREAQTMARWTVAGSLGDLLGPLFLAGALTLGLSWRPVFLLLAGFALGLTTFASRCIPSAASAPDRQPLPSQLLHNMRSALRRPRLLRWLLLLPLADLMLDLFTAYAALYFADVVRLTPAQTALAVTGMMAAGLIGDAVAVPLLDRVTPRRFVRLSAVGVACLYPLWLLIPWPAAKLGLALAIRCGTLGWYAVLQGEAYAAAPSQTGTVMALASLSGLVHAGAASLIGGIAGMSGLPTAMWLLLLGPLALVLGVPGPEAGVTIPPAAPRADGPPPER